MSSPELSPYFWGACIIVLILFGVLGFVVVPNWPSTFQTREQRLSYLNQSIWCPVCNGETIATSQTRISEKLRKKVRSMVESGKSNREIFEYVKKRYSQSQIAVPRNDMLYRVSYGFPYLLIGICINIVLWLAWKWVIRTEQTATDETPDRNAQKESLSKRAREMDSPLR
ncbi:MAG: cytochrome c-type biogenesis protein CcmH [bacterium]